MINGNSMRYVWVVMLCAQDKMEPAHTRIVKNTARVLEFTRSMIDLVGKCDDTEKDISAFRRIDPNDRAMPGFFTIRLGQEKRLAIARAMPESRLTLFDDMVTTSALTVAQQVVPSPLRGDAFALAEVIIR